MELELDRVSGVPIYRQIADDLRESIRRGEQGFQPGDQLPSERDLLRMYEASRPPMRQAYQLLESEGLVVRRQGSGTYVRERPPVESLRSERLSRKAFEKRWSLGAPVLGETASGTRDLKVERVPSPHWVAEKLGMPAGDEVLRRWRRTFIDDEPTMVSDAYYPPDVAEGTSFEKHGIVFGVFYYTLEVEKGYKIDHFTEEWSARLPMPEERHALWLTPDSGRVIFDLTQSCVDETGRVLVVDRAIMDASRYKLVYQIPAI